MTIIELAGILYTTYCEAAGGKNYQGQPLPDWVTFSSDPNCAKQVKSWEAVAKKVAPSFQAVTYVMGRLKDPKVYEILGRGTQAYEHLMDAAVAITGKTKDELMAQYKPDAGALKRLRQETEANRQLVRYCEENGITWNAEEGEIEIEDNEDECRFCGR